MSFLAFKKSYLALITFVLLTLAQNCLASLSAEVNRAMDEANTCQQVGQNHIYSQCMNNNNQRLRDTIMLKTKTQSASFGPSKQKRIKQNVDKKIKQSIKQCLDENAKFGDSMSGNRRHPYCLYENMLELLINVERNIEIYAR